MAKETMKKNVSMAKDRKFSFLNDRLLNRLLKVNQNVSVKVKDRSVSFYKLFQIISSFLCLKKIVKQNFKFCDYISRKNYHLKEKTFLGFKQQGHFVVDN